MNDSEPSELINLKVFACGQTKKAHSPSAKVNI